jgi:hypothetical protein
MAEFNEDDLLKILQAHGQQFLYSFSNANSSSKKRKRIVGRPEESSSHKKVITTPVIDDEDDGEEWGGITEEAGRVHEAESSESEEDGGTWLFAMLSHIHEHAQILNRTMTTLREKVQLHILMLQYSRISHPTKPFPASPPKLK